MSKTITDPQVGSNLPIVTETNVEVYVFPLSFAQQRLCFLHQLAPESHQYNLTGALHLSGPLNVTALTESFNEILRRHETTRTSFALVDGEMMQVIAPHAAIEIEVVDVEARFVDDWITQESRRPFVLAQAPLLRVTLLRLDVDQHVLLVTMHHLISDAWSIRVLVRELTALYTALSSSAPSPLPELPIQYADFTMWQREWIETSAPGEMLNYWRQQLSGELPILNLPTSKPRSVVPTFEGARLNFELPEDLVRELNALSRREGVTLFMLLLASYLVLLHRYTGQDDLLVGSPIANRQRTDIENLIGFFVNLLPLRADLSGDPSFINLLKHVKKLALNAYAHQSLPVEKLIEELRPGRGLNLAPIFQAVFDLHDAHTEELHLPGVSVREIEVDNGTAKFDLSLSLERKHNSISGYFEYSTELFARASMERLQDHWERLLEGIVRDPAQALSALPLLSEAEQQQLLVQWNQTSLPGPAPLVLQQFQEWVRRQPEATAVVCGSERVSYAELQRRAARMRQRLRQLGVKREGRVGVMLRRGPELVAAVLGVLAAGAAYVPLDEEYPAERVEYMLADAGVEVLVCEEEQAERWRSAVREVLAPSGMEESDSEFAEEIEGEQIAYVIYTSGSTGRPKGVAITHRSAAVFLQWAGKQFTPQQLAGTLFSTSICFDLSVFELFAPLNSGGTIIVAENALQLPQLPAADEVTLINTVPSAMNELLRMNAVPDGVQVVNLAGEALPGSLVREIYQRTSVQQVFNLYGPTEDTTYTTCEAVPREETRHPAIGRPIANTQIYLLNETLQPVPFGVAAELHIGGDGLARGYLNRPELTAERFVPDVFSVRGGSRLYRTGDLARYRPDGRIEYLGRLDQQVKLRGFRIELGEIETVLLEHPDVGAVAVDARETGELEKTLIAYLVSSRDTQPAVAELRAYLKRRLPEHMIPQGFVWLAALPLTPNGKINRRALPDPPALRAVTESYLAPRTLTEELLAEIWREVLRVERVGVEDDFFELGGHSLLATQVVSRMKETLQVELPVHSLFTSPTIARLAELVDDWQRQNAPANADPIIPVPRISRRLTVPLAAVRSGRL